MRRATSRRGAAIARGWIWNRCRRKTSTCSTRLSTITWRPRPARGASGCWKTGRTCCPNSSRFSRTNTNGCWALRASRWRWHEEIAPRRGALWARLRSSPRPLGSDLYFRKRLTDMGKLTGFMAYTRQLPGRRAPAARVKDWLEIYQPFPEDHLRLQAARCMDCGVPFCHTGCPLTNIIPDWNDLVYRGHWKEAVRQLHATNNFPEFTGRICPAPCEASCVLGINEPAVTIKQIEKTIIDRAFEEGYIGPEPAVMPSGKRVAIVGSGPAGLAAAQQPARAGHDVTVFEKNDRIGGLLRYGIPNFKMEKHLIDRRVEQMRGEGVKFETNAHVGGNVAVEDLRREFDAILLAGGAEQPRNLHVPGREIAPSSRAISTSRAASSRAS